MCGFHQVREMTEEQKHIVYKHPLIIRSTANGIIGEPRMEISEEELIYNTLQKKLNKLNPYSDCWGLETE